MKISSLLSFVLFLLCMCTLLSCSRGDDIGSGGDSDGDSDSDGDTDSDTDSDTDTDSDGDSDTDSDSDSDSDTDGIAEDCSYVKFGGEPLAIPDGMEDADGNSLAYETSVTLNGFGEGRTLPNENLFLGVCVTMEHTWIRDLQIELINPDGHIVVLNQYMGQDGLKVELGEPNVEESLEPLPGVGYEYCWTPTAENPPMLDYSDIYFGSELINTLPAGDYQASSGFEPLVDSSLNGTWTLRCVDDWHYDNGYIFSWSLNFDPNLIPDCMEFIIE